MWPTFKNNFSYFGRSSAGNGNPSECVSDFLIKIHRPRGARLELSVGAKSESTSILCDLWNSNEPGFEAGVQGKKISWHVLTDNPSKASLHDEHVLSEQICA